MPDLNADTLEFFYGLLKNQQLRLARLAHAAHFRTSKMHLPTSKSVIF
jgi:hypothetical protein